MVRPFHFVARALRAPGGDVTPLATVCSNSANEPHDEDNDYDGSNDSVSEHAECPFKASPAIRPTKLRDTLANE
jgi:hypothetical protein